MFVFISQLHLSLISVAKVTSCHFSAAAQGWLTLTNTLAYHTPLSIALLNTFLGKTSVVALQRVFCVHLYEEKSFYIKINKKD